MAAAERMSTAAAFVLERARPGDAISIASLSRRLIEAGLPRADWTPDRVVRAIRDRDRTVLVARSDAWRHPVGAMAIMKFRDDSANLDLLGVEVDLQRRGLARQMLRWLEESARFAGTFDITVQLRTSNAAALALYRSVGFTEVGRSPLYYQGLEDAIQMRWDLRVAPSA